MDERTEDQVTERPLLLLVDDVPENLRALRRMLRRTYELAEAGTGELALERARQEPHPDLVLLDIVMPGMDGYEVCRQLKADARTRDIPIIFLTGLVEDQNEKHGLDLGAADYITKPMSAPIVLARVKAHLLAKAHLDFLKDKAAFLEAEVSRRTREVVAIQDVTIQALASLAETRDLETGHHIRRTQHYVRLLAERLRATPRYAPVLTEATVTSLFKSAPLHDIGKVGIPDRVLLKPGRLTAEEVSVMRRHAPLGREALEHAEAALGTHPEFLAMAKEIAASHHEKWDGTGYPEGRAGEAIPLPARLMAVADVYDALRSQRVYKAALAHDDAVAAIVRGRGHDFDPDVVDAFVAAQAEFRAISERFVDPVAPAVKTGRESITRTFSAAAVAT